MLPLCFAVGLVIGPALGGFLSRPADQFPSTFGRIQFFRDYPYFLPCFVAGFLNLCAVIIGALFLKEVSFAHTDRGRTLISNTQTLPARALAKGSDDPSAPSKPKAPPPSVLSLLKSRQILTSMVAFGLLAMHNSAWSVLVPLFAYTRVSDGGLGLSLQLIGVALSTNGVVTIVIQVLFFPPLQRRFGTLPVYRCSAFFNVLAFVMLPLMAALGRSAGVGDGGKVGGLIVALTMKACGTMAIGATTSPTLKQTPVS